VSAGKYIVEDTGRRINDTEVWTVMVKGDVSFFPKRVAVWRSTDGMCRCTECSGPLSAMLSTCAHAQAVKRHRAKREERK
jgi:hypothetical protein